MNTIRYKKVGLVKLQPTGVEPITLKDPAGETIGHEFLPLQNKIVLHIRAVDQDGRNNVERKYDIELDNAAIADFHVAFLKHIARLGKVQFPEFDGLDIDPASIQFLIDQGVDLSFLQA